MNAKKIMGAVLVALLAAALFVGAGAAMYNGDTVFVNQKLDASYGGTWVSADKSVTAVPVPGTQGAEVYFPAGSEGIYTQEVELNNAQTTTYATFTLIVKSPEVIITGTAGEDAAAYDFMGKTFYKGSSDVNVDAEVFAGTYSGQSFTPLAFDLYLTYPSGKEEKMENAGAIANFLETGKPAVGDYGIYAVFKSADFVNGTILTDLITKPVTFKVVEQGDGTISASTDKALKGEAFKITVTGQPGITYEIKFEKNHLTVPGKQLYLPEITTDKSESFQFTMPNTGKIDFVIAATNNADNSEKIELIDTTDAESQGYVTIAFAKGTITGKTEAPSYFVGDEVKVTGTSTAGKITQILMEGTNFDANLTTMLVAGDKISYEEVTSSTQDFEFELNTAALYDATGKIVDVGAYTLTLVTETKAKATVTVVLKQPFISIISAPEVVVKGIDAEFLINAEAAQEGIIYYIFGTNYYAIGNVTTPVDAKKSPNQFKIGLNGDEIKAKMDAGQYFMVVQHPMYDNVFNIHPDYVESNTTILLDDGAGTTELFNVDKRQTANAAQALCDALDTQNIDDMYVKLSFIVAGEDESFAVNDIPTEITKGSTFTVSGTATAYADEYVVVEMISTAFAAVPKETVGSAAFIVLTTQVAEDGTWEVTFDTTDLNVDEYSIKVACGDATWKNVNVNVVEAADEPVTPPTDEPGQDEPGQDEPEAPATPGFGALAALAGLGAVAVLLLRRE